MDVWWSIKGAFLFFMHVWKFTLSVPQCRQESHRFWRSCRTTSVNIPHPAPKHEATSAGREDGGLISSGLPILESLIPEEGGSLSAKCKDGAWASGVRGPESESELSVMFSCATGCVRTTWNDKCLAYSRHAQICFISVSKSSLEVNWVQTWLYLCDEMLSKITLLGDWRSSPGKSLILRKECDLNKALDPTKKKRFQNCRKKWFSVTQIYFRINPMDSLLGLGVRQGYK